MKSCKMLLNRFDSDATKFCINKFCQNIRFTGRRGRWHGIDFVCLSNYAETCDYAVALFEHDIYGDEAALILAFYDRYSERWIELAETFDNIEVALIDEDII